MEPLDPSQKQKTTPKEPCWQRGRISHLMERCRHAEQGADASCHSTVGTWILTLRISALSCPWGSVMAGAPSQSVDLGHRALFQPRARQLRAVDPQARPRVRVWAGAASASQNTAPFPWKPAPPISNSSAANALRLLV